MRCKLAFKMEVCVFVGVSACMGDPKGKLKESLFIQAASQ